MTVSQTQSNSSQNQFQCYNTVVYLNVHKMSEKEERVKYVENRQLIIQFLNILLYIILQITYHYIIDQNAHRESNQVLSHQAVF